MKTRWILAIVVILLALFALRPRQPRTEEATAPESASRPPSALSGTTSAAPSTAPTANPATPGSAPTTRPAPTDGDVSPPAETPVPLIGETPEAVREAMDNVQFALRDYRTVLGENPIGSNAEITRALTGANLKQVKIPIPVGSSLSADGEMCDRWSTPYFFHQLSGKEMEIHSAGPDRQMHTKDDLVVK